MLIVLATYDVGKLFCVSDLYERVFSRMRSVCFGLPERCLLLGSMPIPNGLKRLYGMTGMAVLCDGGDSSDVAYCLVC